MLHPRLFEATPEGPFSLNLVSDKASEAERLWGLRHDGEWFHDRIDLGLYRLLAEFGGGFEIRRLLSTGRREIVEHRVEHSQPVDNALEMRGSVS